MSPNPLLLAGPNYWEEVTRHYEGRGEGEGFEVMPVSDIKVVELTVDGEGAVFLLRFDIQGQCVADTWHVSVEDAKAQAEFEFEIKADDWVEL